MLKSKHTLDKLFGSRVRVKILKFMFRNYPGSFGAREIAKKIQESFDSTKRELGFLAKLRLIQKNQ